MKLLSRVRRLLGRKTQIPVPPDDGFRPSTYSEGYGTSGDTHEAGGPTTRCESRKVEGKRSWRCVHPAGHQQWPDTFLPYHRNNTARRSWL